MSYYTPLDYDSTDISDKSSRSTSTIPGESHGKSPKSTHEKSPGREHIKSAKSVDGKSPKKSSIKSLDKLHRKLPYKLLDKSHRPSDGASVRGEIEHYHSTKIEGTISEDFKGLDILSKITGLDTEVSPDKPSHATSTTHGRQQKTSSTSGITPKITHPAKPGIGGLKERERTVNDRLYNACLTGDLNTVKDILRVHYTTLMPDEQGQTPLYAACIGNQPEIIEYLVDYGYAVDHQDKDGKTPLHIAFECDELTIAKLLLVKYQASYKIRDARNWTPFHSAIDHGYYDEVSSRLHYFLEQDANTDVSWIQLLAACHERKLDTVKFLLAKTADVNHVSSSGHTALFMACAQNNAAIVKLLLENGAQETINHRAVAYNLVPIHIACDRGNVSVVQQMLDHNADPNLLDTFGNNCLQLALQKCRQEVVPLLLKAGVSASASNKDGASCLHLAIYKQCNVRTLQLLIEYGAPLEHRNKKGETALLLASRKRQQDAIHLLLNSGCDPNVEDENDYSVLFYAIYKHCDERTIQAIIGRGAQIDVLYSRRVSPLVLACRKDNYGAIRVLLDAKADPGVADKDGDTALHNAIHKGLSQHIIHEIVLHCKQSDLDAVNNTGESALMLACRSHQNESVLMLLKAGASTEQFDDHGDTCLHSAVRKSCKTETVQALLDHGASLNAINLKGYTALMIACADEPSDLFTLLLQNGADPNITDFEGDTPLHVACMKNDINKVALLLKHSANPTSKNDAGREPLGFAARANSPLLLEAFYNHKPNLLNIIIDSCETVLHYCCRNGRTDMVEWMLGHRIDKDKISAQGSPLDLALSHGHKNIVFMLLDAGANVSMSPERQSFLERIYQQRHLYMDILKHIVEKNCKVDLTAHDTAHETLFFKACRDDAVDVVEMLLDSKHDIGINICNKQGQTPVAIICANAAKPETEALTLLSMIVNSNRVVDVDAADRKKTTPLHLVCQQDNTFMVNLILRTSRGSVNAQDSMGRTPLQLAKTAEVINLLVAFGATKD